MVQLVPDVLLLIFAELQNYPSSLYSCILVNSSWCCVAVPILWKFISYGYDAPSDHKLESREKLYNVIAHFLPNGPKDPLSKNNISLPLNKFPRKPMFEYMKYFTRIHPGWIRDMIQLSINEGSTHKKNVLESEIYKLIFNKCNNVKHFYWITTEKLCSYPNAKPFFSSLQSLVISLEFNTLTSQILPELSNICHNIINLEICYCKEDSSDLVTFIDMQHNLQSLCLHLGDENFEIEENDDENDDGNAVDWNNIEEKQYTLLSDVILKKADKLKQITLTPIITLIDPEFLSSSVNIQNLELNNDDGMYMDIDWRKWGKCLDKASFPHLKYFGTTFLPSNIESLIIEKSGGNVLEIDIRYPLEFHDYPAENVKLIRTIYNNCPKLRKLTLNIDPKNLREVSGIFSNCTQLEKLHLTTKNYIIPNGDELLKIISNESPATLREFSFGDNWNFSLKGLESFFIYWKCQEKFPIKFTNYYDEMIYSWTDDHKKLVERYRQDGTIR
ncbi:hypothetical protein RclHR1_25580002 [Rhizophagus clarus]|uniref:F-box domain-containing protein n=1 Tax=Rhizophagus clarus TaxID=94130 RepID=A0A2Z6RD43_9GLOM|nr:hypothetical protein RclHR1_25580002 [Rhizophagus clarus]GES83833.1 hypothetical protein GLOIN_2v1770441 [Rhizophagus clarus]